MDEMLKAALIDYFEAGDFADYIGISVGDMIEAFPDEVDDALDELKELMEYGNLENDDD